MQLLLGVARQWLDNFKLVIYFVLIEKKVCVRFCFSSFYFPHYMFARFRVCRCENVEESS